MLSRVQLSAQEDVGIAHLHARYGAAYAPAAMGIVGEASDAALEADLRHAIEVDELEVHYQADVSLSLSLPRAADRA